MQRRQLITQRLARTGGEDRRRRTPSQNGRDHTFLTGAQLLEAEHTFQGTHGCHSIDRRGGKQ